MRILLVDIETAPNTAYVWGLYDQNISHQHLKETSYILCWAAKWVGNNELMSRNTKGHEPGSPEYKLMLLAMWKLLDEADVVVHYYGSKFDIPVLNREFAKYKLPPPSPYRQVDLKLVVAKAFRFESNKLDHVAYKLGLGRKIETDFDLWIGCMDNKSSDWKHMIKYNKQDVVLLGKLYTRLLPWIDRHPSHSAFDGELCCPKCGSRHIHKRGTQIASLATYTRYNCQECGAWFRNNKRTNKQGERGVNIV
jgi:DNA-directed RNA polymerase subunit RPC12/RpoP/DNA polymerase elongation subunit (family B)